MAKNKPSCFQSTRTINFHAARKHLAGKHADVTSLLDDCLCGGIRLRREFRFVYLPVEAFEALATRDKFGLADSHRSASSCIRFTTSRNSRIAEINSDCAAFSRQSHGTTNTS